METLKAHKQIIANVKTQTWPMHRKLKVRILLSCLLVMLSLKSKKTLIRLSRVSIVRSGY